MTITPAIKAVLSSSTIDEDKKTIVFNCQLDRKTYTAVNEILNTVGFTWNKKLKAHIGNVSPNDALKVIFGSNTGTITTTLETKKEAKKKYQAFYTPDALADRMVELAHIQKDDILLEPSAGNGAIVKAILRVWPNKIINCYEIDDAAIYELGKLGHALMAGKDFLDVSKFNQSRFWYDKILMNPPFQKHQDIQHVRHAYDNFLQVGGRIVAIMSPHPFFASHKIDKEFVAWLDELGATVEDIPAGTFAESGTQIATKLVVIDK